MSEESEERARRKLSRNRPRKALGIGVPAVVVAVLAVLLGIPWWIVLAVLLVLGLMIITNS